MRNLIKVIFIHMFVVDIFINTGIEVFQNSFTKQFLNFIGQLNPFELPHTSFVTDLAIIMILAAVVTLAFFKIKQPLIVGYLFVGMLIGPLSPLWTWFLPDSRSMFDDIEGIGILSDISALNLFAEIGVILLLFVIGIEFPYAKIRSIGKVSIGIGSLGLFLTLGVIFYLSTAIGFNFMDSLFVAASLSVSSTAIILKILVDFGRIKKESSVLILGILIVEDVIAVILIASLESIALVGSISIEGVLVISLVATGLITGTFTIGTKIVPPLIDKVARAENKEILLLSVLGVCFGYALFANIVGLSVAIGAFLAGVLIAESKSSEVSKIISGPIKDMFVAIFFVSVGALMDISQIQNYIVVAIILISVTIAMKFVSNLTGNFIFRKNTPDALRSAFVLAAPRGEFSIVIVKVGVDLGVISSFLFPLVGIICITTAFISPFLFSLGEKIISKMQLSK